MVTLQCWSGGTNLGLSLTPSLPLDNVAWPLRKDDGVSSSGHCCTALYKDGVTLDIAAWPLRKNDSQDLRWVVFFFFERYGNMACTRMTRTNSGFFFFPSSL